MPDALPQLFSILVSSVCNDVENSGKTVLHSHGWVARMYIPLFMANSRPRGAKCLHKYKLAKFVQIPGNFHLQQESLKCSQLFLSLAEGTNIFFRNWKITCSGNNSILEIDEWTLSLYPKSKLDIIDLYFNRELSMISGEGFGFNIR